MVFLEYPVHCNDWVGRRIQQGKVLDGVGVEHGVRGSFHTGRYVQPEFRHEWEVSERSERALRKTRILAIFNLPNLLNSFGSLVLLLLLLH